LTILGRVRDDVVESACPDAVPAVMPLPCPHFACLLAWDATAVREAELTALARQLLLPGCMRVCCWGPGCERDHDLFDLADQGLRPDGPFARLPCGRGRHDRVEGAGGPGGNGRRKRGGLSLGRGKVASARPFFPRL
jgi:hypothetical protein